MILAEDTRKTGQLLSKHSIKKRLESFHEHNEEIKIDSILTKLKSKQDIALVSDAGTPLISDPGYKLIREAIKIGIKIVSVPGASAVTAALIASGLPTDKFIFLGYFPKKKSKQEQTLKLLQSLWSQVRITAVFFDSPFRVRKTLDTINAMFPEIDVVLAREITKIHEEFVRGKVKDVVAKNLKTKGEFTLLLKQ